MSDLSFEIAKEQNDTLIERLDWVATVAEDTEGLGNKAYLICDKAVDTITIQAERIAKLEEENAKLREAAQAVVDDIGCMECANQSIKALAAGLED